MEHPLFRRWFTDVPIEIRVFHSYVRLAEGKWYNCGTFIVGSITLCPASQGQQGGLKILGIWTRDFGCRYGGFLKSGYLQILHFTWIFPSKP